MSPCVQVYSAIYQPLIGRFIWPIALFSLLERPDDELFGGGNLVIRPNRSIIYSLIVIAVIGPVLIITASGGLFCQKRGTNSLTSHGKLIFYS